MKHRVDLSNRLDSTITKLEYEDEKVCPICKTTILPYFIAASLNNSTTASVFCYCGNCEQSFVTMYSVSLITSGRTGSYRIAQATEKKYSEPNRFEDVFVDEEIENISPQFVKIFNQALAARAMNLNEIAGLGYRKALEFLVKDYAIKNNKGDAEKIEGQKLSACINNYIHNEKIRILAEKSTWIGNDEAHYVRRHADLNVDVMKEFIEALVYSIKVDLIAEKAANIQSK